MAKSRIGTLSRSKSPSTLTKSGSSIASFASDSLSTLSGDTIDGGTKYIKMKSEKLQELFSDNQESITAALDEANNNLAKCGKLIKKALKLTIPSDAKAYFMALDIVYEIQDGKNVKFKTFDPLRIIANKEDRTSIVHLKSFKMALDHISKIPLKDTKNNIDALKILVEKEIEDIIAKFIEKNIDTIEEYNKYKEEIKKLGEGYFNGQEYSEFNKKFIDLAIKFADYTTAAEYMIGVCNKNDDYASVIQLLKTLKEIGTIGKTLEAKQKLFKAAREILKKITKEDEPENQKAETDYYKFLVNYTKISFDDEAIGKLMVKASNRLEVFTEVDDIKPLIYMAEKYNGEDIGNNAFNQVARVIYKKDLQKAVEDNKYTSDILLQVGIHAYNDGKFQEAVGLFNNVAKSNGIKGATAALWHAKVIMRNFDSLHPNETGDVKEKLIKDILKSAIGKSPNIYIESNKLETLVPLIKVYCEKKMVTQFRNTLEKCYELVNNPVNAEWDQDKLTSTLMDFAKWTRKSGKLDDATMIFDAIGKTSIPLSVQLEIKRELENIKEVKEAKESLSKSDPMDKLEQKYKEDLAKHSKEYYAGYKKYREDFLEKKLGIDQAKYQAQVDRNNDKYLSEQQNMQQAYVKKVHTYQHYEHIITTFCPLEAHDDVGAIGVHHDAM
ncbi:MAG: hypothetical protein LN588_04755 [Rickettsia endosymbiont of Bryobia graminum]|nr:hypothetical protein [Rickettsia endosymbiont of Bryobia graminum]